jgi:putative PIN family toxin of toxin-antitoxin system
MSRTLRDVPRIVLDTNVVVSALVFGGSIARLRSVWQAGTCMPLISAATVHELVRVLAYPKFRLEERERDDLLADYLPYAQAVRIASAPTAGPRCRDPFDQPFLELALAGKASALVSGDRDLLALSGRTACAVLTPEKFMASIDLRATDRT